MRIKSKCPLCGEVVSADWKMSPILLRCKEGHKWAPRQDVLAAVYVHKSLTEEKSLDL